MSIEDNFFEDYCDDLQRQQEDDQAEQEMLDRINKRRHLQMLEPDGPDPSDLARDYEDAKDIPGGWNGVPTEYD